MCFLAAVPFSPLLLGVLVLASSGDWVSVIFTLPASLGDMGFGAGLVVGDVGRRLYAAVSSGVCCFEAGDSGLRLLTEGDSGRCLSTNGDSGRRLLAVLSRCISRAVSRYRDSADGTRSFAVRAVAGGVFSGLAEVVMGSGLEGFSGLGSGLVGVMISVTVESSPMTGVEGRNVRLEIFMES